MVRLFEKSDWSAIEDPIEPGVASVGNMDIFDRGLGVTVIDGDNIIGCGGIVLTDDNNGEMWVRLSKKARPIVVAAGVKAGFNILVDSFPDISIWCRVQKGFIKGKRLVERLGFAKEKESESYWVYRCQ